MIKITKFMKFKIEHLSERQWSVKCVGVGEWGIQ